MKLYDEIIRTEMSLAKETGKGAVPLPFSLEEGIWPDSGKNGIVLKADMQCELGGGSRRAVASQAVTLDDSLVPDDGLFLIGPDLSGLEGEHSYARMTWILLQEEAAREEKRLYETVRALEYARYRVNPYGYMQRISLTGHREPVRISRRAVREGLDFSKVGSLYLQAYRKNPAVKAVRIFFFTDPDTDFSALERAADKTEQVTKALDHVLKDFRMDCSSCNLKEVCDEVEELKELHFQRKG